MKLGKKPARSGAMTFLLSNYVDLSKLPPVPQDFGHDAAVGPDWQLFSNDKFGCCVFAGAAHETMLWNREGGHAVGFSDQSVLSDYSALTGFDPEKPETDQGTDMTEAAEYRRTTGVLDASGARHKIAAYLALDAGDPNELWAAAYLFGAVGIGLELPDSAEPQFDAGKPWTFVPGAQTVGGHYVSLVGRRHGMLHVVTWGKVQPVSAYFIGRYCDEAATYLSLEALTNNKSPEGFDSAALLADLAALKGE